MNVGPTVRIDLLSGAGPVDAVPADVVVELGAASGAGVASGAAAAGAEPFLAGTAACLGGARDIFLALFLVTIISPCCSAAALSSMLFRASDQVCPAALHAQDGLNSWR